MRPKGYADLSGPEDKEGYPTKNVIGFPTDKP